MKRILFFSGFLLFSAFVFGQNADSLAAARQVDSLMQVSRALTAKRDFVKALEVNESAEKIALEKLGRESEGYGKTCNNRGRVLYFKGDYPEAEKWCLEAKAIRELVLGKEHPDFARSLNSLAILYVMMGNYEKAEPLYLEANAIWKKVLGRTNPDLAGSLNNLAVLYTDMGNYEKAEPLYLEAIAIRKEVLGKTHPNYAQSLNNLASLYSSRGKYNKAESLYLEAIAIWEKVLGRKNPDFAQSLINLAILYNDMGNYEKAEPFYLEAMDIFEKSLKNTSHPDYMRCLNGLGALYGDIGRYEKAESLFLEAKSIRTKVIGTDHPDYATSLSNLAILYHRMGQYEKAEPLYLEAKAINEKVFGREHPNFAGNLNGLGALYSDMGNYEKAEPFHLEAKVILEKIMGKENSDFVECLINLAILYEKQNRFSDSGPLLTEVYTLDQTRLAGAAAFLSEQELAKYVDIFQKKGDHLVALLLNRPPGQAENLPGLIFDYTLFYKGFLLAAAIRLDALSAASPESEEINNRLKGYRRRLAAEYAKPVAERKGVADLLEKSNYVEKELARTVTGYAEAIRQLSWEEVKSALRKEEAAIEFVHFKVNFPIRTDNTMYAAVLLRPDDTQPVFIPLFEENQLAAETDPNNKEQRSELFAQIYSRGIKPLKTTQIADLYKLIWQPMDSLLSKTTTVYFSPSGLLHRINLGAIPIGEGETLSDRYKLRELNSTRQLVIPTEVNIANQNAVLFGGIQYELDSTVITAAKLPYESEQIAARGELSFTYTDSNYRRGAWNYLKWTEKEVDNISATLAAAGIQADTRKGNSATEESFKAIGQGGPSPRIIHLATHGFFFPDPKASPPSPLSGGEGELVFRISDHPMIRSGLLLAGANHAWTTGKPLKPGMEDGILTAYEISQMNLSNTELVVLSACETGLGDIQGNEGVYGLQRAFKIAGAKYLIMSLWQVPDKQTSLLMTTFYRKWLKEKMAIPEAFRAAQKELREAGLDPYQWAGFVLVE